MTQIIEHYLEIQKRQVDAIGQLSSSDNAKIILLPNDIISALSSIKNIFGK
jgi:hypothetical protein